MVHGTVRVTPVYGDTLTYRGIGGESTDGPGSVRVTLDSKVEARPNKVLLDLT